MTDRILRVHGKRGMKKFRPGSIKLRFGNILNRRAPAGVLPSLPSGTWFGHLSNHEPFQWGMLGNDQAGDCVIAGGMHETMVLQHAGNRSINCSFSTQNALQQYSQFMVSEGGSPFNPHDPNTDTGLDPQMAAERRRTVGLVDEKGVVYKIDAYAAINNWEEALYAIHLFGVVGAGWALPDSAESQFTNGQPWSDTAGTPGDGHYTPIGQLNSNGDMVAITWGDLQGVTKSWFNRYCDILIAYISREYMQANGKSPEAIDWEALNSYLRQLPTV